MLAQQELQVRCLEPLSLNGQNMDLAQYEIGEEYKVEQRS
jgi:hypothetical protein